MGNREIDTGQEIVAEQLFDTVDVIQSPSKALGEQTNMYFTDKEILTVQSTWASRATNESVVITYQNGRLEFAFASVNDLEVGTYRVSGTGHAWIDGLGLQMSDSSTLYIDDSVVVSDESDKTVATLVSENSFTTETVTVDLEWIAPVTAVTARLRTYYQQVV